MTEPSPDLSKIAAFLEAARESGFVADLDGGQEEQLRASLAALTDTDPYFVAAANYKPCELALMFQRAAEAHNRAVAAAKEINSEQTLSYYSGSELKCSVFANIEAHKAAHAAARDSLGRLASGIVERARFEKGLAAAPQAKGPGG
jgi:hypothetical protein